MAEIFGTAGDDTLRGPKNEHNGIYGFDGDDLLIGGTLGDVLSGGSGNDELRGGKGLDTLYGDAGDDILIGGEWSDKLYGGAGADQFVFDTKSLYEDVSPLGKRDVIYDLNFDEGDSLVFDLNGQKNDFTIGSDAELLAAPETYSVIDAVGQVSGAWVIAIDSGHLITLDDFSM